MVKVLLGFRKINVFNDFTLEIWYNYKGDIYGEN